MNPFSEGQKVVCVSDKFPTVTTTGEDKSRIGQQAVIHPKKDEVLVIDEILGDYLGFEKYNIHDPEHPEYGWQWWHHTSFAPVDEVLASRLVEELLNETTSVGAK